MTRLRRSVFSALAPAMLACSAAASAHDYPRLDQALPSGIDIGGIYPIFDYDGDGCLRYGEQNGGLAASGGITSGCRRSDFLGYSNTLHRYACLSSGGVQYCGHFFSLYFLKDQATVLGGGHRHDWEYAAIWTQNGVVTHAGYSAHGDLYNKPVSQVARENGHVKFVYHKDGVLTHALRFASSSEAAENPYGRFDAPTIVSWYTLRGATLDNASMRSRLNAFNYGSATIPLKDSHFLTNLNTYRPSGYPSFTAGSVDNSR
jgi:hypothetical protein